MKNIPQFVLDKSMLENLKPALLREALEIQKTGGPKQIVEGVEQDWMCRDKLGVIFLFGICEVTDRNARGLKGGSVLLLLGPRPKDTLKRPRKEILAFYERFERVVIALGGRKIN